MAKLGIALPNYGQFLSSEGVVRVAREAESLGYDSIWTTDHVLMGKDYAYPYGIILETFTTLSYVAAVTSSISIGTSIISLPLRNPILLAKQAATLDVLSGGRLILGVGVGGGEDDVLEFGYLGANYRERGRYADEALKIIKTLWTQKEPTFEGRFYRFSECVFEPKPVQKPHPPIWIGGSSEAAIRRVVESGDGWHPTLITPTQYSSGVDKIKRMNKGDRPLVFSVRLIVEPLREGEKPSVSDLPIIQGSPGTLAERLSEYVKAGAEHLVFYLGDVETDKYLERMRVIKSEVAPSI